MIDVDKIIEAKKLLGRGRARTSADCIEMSQETSGGLSEQIGVPVSDGSVFSSPIFDGFPVFIDDSLPYGDVRTYTKEMWESKCNRKNSVVSCSVCSETTNKWDAIKIYDMFVCPDCKKKNTGGL